MTYMTKATPSPETVIRRDGMPPLYDARGLTDGGQIALLELDGQIYTLRITRSSKLILTK